MLKTFLSSAVPLAYLVMSLILTVVCSMFRRL